MKKETFIDKFKGKISCISKKGPAELLDEGLRGDVMEEFSSKNVQFNNAYVQHAPSSSKDLGLSLERNFQLNEPYGKLRNPILTNDGVLAKTTSKKMREFYSPRQETDEIYHNGNLSSKNNQDNQISPDSLEKLFERKMKINISKANNCLLNNYAKEVCTSGGLGANFSEDWQNKRMKKEKQESYAEMVKELNAQKAKKATSNSQKTAKKLSSDNYSKQRRAAEFAKNISKPAKKEVQKPLVQAPLFKRENGCLEILAHKHADLQNMVNRIK